MNGSLKVEDVVEAVGRLSSDALSTHEIRIDCNAETPPELAELDQFRGPHHVCWDTLWNKVMQLIGEGCGIGFIERTCRPSIIRVENEG